MRDGHVEIDEVRLIGVEQLQGVRLQIDVGVVALADIVGADVAVSAGGGLDLANHLLEGESVLRQKGSRCAIRPSMRSRFIK